MTVPGRRVVPVDTVVPSVPPPITTTSPTTNPRIQVFMERYLGASCSAAPAEMA